VAAPLRLISRRRPAPSWARGAAAAALVALAPAADAAVPAGGPGGRAVLTPLQVGLTLSHWAYPVSAAIVRAAPNPSARRVARLRFLTSDGQAELYLALASLRLPSGATWVQLRIPARPNGLTGWVRRSALGTLNVGHRYLIINRERLRATLLRRGRVIFSAPIGVGKPGTITPAGHFYVVEKLTSLHAPFYGPFAFGTSAYAPTLSEWPGGGVVGIHGTSLPQLIPGRPSHGCIRMRNRDITRLWRLLGVGTPIDIV
jgi:hypothetical protein